MLNQLFIILLFTQIKFATSSDIEKQLYDDLRKNYEPLERPVQNSSDPVMIKLGLTLNQIVDVNEKDQVVTVNAWLKYVTIYNFVAICTLDIIRHGKTIKWHGSQKNTEA
jgi:hypothetical protein